MNKDTKKMLIPKLRFPEFQNAMGWEEKKLKDAISPVVREVLKPDTNYLALGIRSHGKGTFHKPDQAPEKNAMDKLYLVNRDDLIVNITFAWEGAIAIADHADHGCLVSHRFPTYTFKSKSSTPKFFRHLINKKSFFHKLELISPGGAGRNRVMNKKDFLEMPIVLPELKEQQKIADCLSSIDELISVQRKKVEALNTHKKGLMQQLFPREGETVPRLRFPEFRDAGEWEEKTLKDVCKMQAGKFVRAVDIFEKNEGNYYPCYGGNGQRGFTKSFTHEGKYSLIGRQGALCGNVTLALNKFHATEHAVVVSPSKGVDTDWLFFMLGYMNLNQYATGQAQPGLSVENLEKLPLAISAEEKEQQKIASFLSSIDELITAQSQKLETFKTHKKSLMQQLFPLADAANAEAGV